MTENWTASECACALDITEAGWRKYVSQGRAARRVGEDHWAPEPIGYDMTCRRLVWNADAVRRGHASRLGRGARTDLQERGTP